MPGMSYTLNAKQKAVLATLPSPAGDDKTGEFVTLEDMAKKAFGSSKRGSSPKSQGNSWVRNSLRKLVSLGLVKGGPGRSGTYARTRVTLAEIADKENARVAKKEEKEKKAAERKAKATKVPKKAA